MHMAVQVKTLLRMQLFSVSWVQIPDFIVSFKDEKGLVARKQEFHGKEETFVVVIAADSFNLDFRIVYLRTQKAT